MIRITAVGGMYLVPLRRIVLAKFCKGQSCAVVVCNSSDSVPWVADAVNKPKAGAAINVSNLRQPSLYTIRVAFVLAAPPVHRLDMITWLKQYLPWPENPSPRQPAVSIASSGCIGC